MVLKPKIRLFTDKETEDGVTALQEKLKDAYGWHENSATGGSGYRLNLDKDRNKLEVVSGTGIKTVLNVPPMLNLIKELWVAPYQVQKRPPGSPEAYTPQQIIKELEFCSQSPLYFIMNYVKIFSNDHKGWISFKLWNTYAGDYDNQHDVIHKYQENNRLVVLKARQLGLSWLFISLFLWSMLFEPVAFVLMVSRGEDEAKELLWRMKGIYKHLPRWMLNESILVDTKTEWSFSNGSQARALSTRKGDSFTATHVLIDEAELVHESGISLEQILLKVEPTVGQNGKLVLLSKSDKRNPQSTMKRIYRAAVKGQGSYVPAFIPFYIHPMRDLSWYVQKVVDSLTQDGTLDTLYESYPATPEEAMAPKQINKRFKMKWLSQVQREWREPLLDMGKIGDEARDYEILQSILNYKFENEVVNRNHFEKTPETDELVPFSFFPDLIPTFDNLRFYKLPYQHGEYVIGADPSSGGDGADPSPIIVMDVDTKEDVAVFDGCVDPTVLAEYIRRLSEFYNNAPCLFELNNHGHALRLALQSQVDGNVKLLKGYATRRTARKIGWEQSAKNKPLMCDTTADYMRRNSVIINDDEIAAQIANIEEDTLKAPKGLHDDLSVAYCLCVCAVHFSLESKSMFTTLNAPQ